MQTVMILQEFRDRSLILFVNQVMVNFRGLPMNIQGINHLTFSVSNLEESVAFYKEGLGATLLVKGNNLAYFSLNGIWIALNVETDIARSEIYQSYSHIAFSINESDYDMWLEKLIKLKVNIIKGRSRNDRDQRSIYFTDPDGQKFELHTGKIEDRLEFYKENKPHMTFYNK